MFGGDGEEDTDADASGEEGDFSGLLDDGDADLFPGDQSGSGDSLPSGTPPADDPLGYLEQPKDDEINQGPVI